MRHLHIQLPSLAFGFFLAAVLGGLMGQQTIGFPVLEVLRVVDPVCVQVPTHPRDLVQLDFGSTFTVPAGRLLVLKRFGGYHGGANGVLRVNGIPFMDVDGSGMNSLQDPYPTTGRIEPGLVFDSGDIIDFVGAENGAALGYLVDA